MKTSEKYIKFTLSNLGYDKEGYNHTGYMDWLDKKNNIIFFTKLKIKDVSMFEIIKSKENFKIYIPGISSKKDYKIALKLFGGVPAIIKFDLNLDYSKILKDFFEKELNFFEKVKKYSKQVKFPQYDWLIYQNNYKSIKLYNEKESKISIKIKKIKI